MKKSLVAYFSATGVTAGVAKRLAHVLGADTFEICPKVPYTKEDLNWTDNESRSSVEMRDPDCRPALTKRIPNLKSYEVIFVGFPVWWYREPSIIDTFLEEADFSGKLIVLFVTSGGSELGPGAESVRQCVPTATIKGGRRFDANASEQVLLDWAKQWV